MTWQNLCLEQQRMNKDVERTQTKDGKMSWEQAAMLAHAVPRMLSVSNLLSHDFWGNFGGATLKLTVKKTPKQQFGWRTRNQIKRNDFQRLPYGHKWYSCKTPPKKQKPPRVK